MIWGTIKVISGFAVFFAVCYLLATMGEWIEAWTNEDLAKELKGIADLNLSPRETASRADTFLKRAIENTQRRSVKEAALRSAGVDVRRELNGTQEEDG